ncbi:MAG: aldo/keto reductase [bacterium]|nr:aldo/keto reductase [bacterium]
MKTVRDICLGTVKLGNPDYGFSSSSQGDAFDFDAMNFLEEAGRLGISRFDTSPRYGRSEKVLGEYFKSCANTPWVSSKIDGLVQGAKETPRSMLKSVEKSLRTLNLEVLDLCYLHQNDLEIISDPYVHEGFALLKEKQLIKEAGVSLYSIDECRYATVAGVFDTIQVPVSVFDLKFYNYLVENRKKRVKIIARSLLLQGILTNRENIVPKIKQSREIVEYLNALDTVAVENKLSVLEMALGFVFSLPGIDHCVIGTTSMDSLKQNIGCLKLRISDNVIKKICALASVERNWSNPRNWNI